MEESRNIPSSIKREVRQRCGFGCVICGKPLYEYDHIEDYAIVKEHKLDNLTLLCDLHHREKTNRLLDLNQVIEANKEPFNLKNRLSTPYKFNFKGASFNLKIGDCELLIEKINPERDFIIPFLINNKKLISFDTLDNQLFFNLVVRNKAGDLLLKIVENEMVYSSEQWDIEFIGTRLKLRAGSRKILFDIEFNIPNGVQIHAGEFNYEVFEFVVKDGGIHAKNLQMFVKQFVNFRILFACGEYDGNMPACIRYSN